MELQTTYLALLHTKLLATPAIRAVWLEGSLGRNNGDRYSDLDLHAVVEDVDALRSTAQTWLNQIRPLVLYKVLFDGRMINAMTVDGLRLDLWLHPQAPPLLDRRKVKVIYDPATILILGELPTTAAANDPAALLTLLEEFWRCFAMLPVVIGRKEWIVSLQGLTVELNVLLDILCRGYAIQREAGVKSLNRFLPNALRSEIEAALAMEGLSEQSLIRSHWALAKIVQNHGRVIAERAGFNYPVTLEEAVAEYVKSEICFDLA